MRIIKKFATALEAMMDRFHDGQTPGEVYKQPPEYHSLGGRGGGKRDGNGNLLDAQGRVVGRNQAFYGGSPGNSWLGNCGAYRRLTGRG
jgi:hypothetical protein